MLAEQTLLSIQSMVREVDAFITVEIEKLTDSQLRSACSHIVSGKSKSIRPALTLLACELIDGYHTKAISIAAAINMVHNAMILYDDVMHDNGMRRGKPTIHLIYGKPFTLMLAEFCHSKAYEFISQAEKYGATDKAIKATLESFISFSVDCSSGVASYYSSLEAIKECVSRARKDRNFAEIRTLVTEKNYIEAVKSRTGLIFGTSAKLGGLIAGCDSKTADQLNAYGTNLGIGYQLIDDALDYLPVVKKAGKNPGREIAEGRVGLVTQFMLANDSYSEIIIESLGKAVSTGTLETIMQAAYKSGALIYNLERAKDYISLAWNTLNNIGSEETRKKMAQFNYDLAVSYYNLPTPVMK